MKQRPHVPGLRVSLLAYRWFLKLHSSHFQEECGGEMMLHHEYAYRDAWVSGAWSAICLLWLREIWGLPNDVTAEYKMYRKQNRYKREKSMKPIVGSLAVVSSELLMILAGLIGAAFWLALVGRGTLDSGIEQSIWFLILFDGPILLVGFLCLVVWLPVAKAMN